MPLDSFFTLGRYEKTKDFLMFSVGIKILHWHNLGQRVVSHRVFTIRPQIYINGMCWEKRLDLDFFFAEICSSSKNGLTGLHNIYIICSKALMK